MLARGTYFMPVKTALETAGYEVARRTSARLILKAPGRPSVNIPRRIEDIGLAKKIVKLGGAHL